jgi:hypothetical protein
MDMVQTLLRIRHKRNQCMTILKWVHHVGFIFLFVYFSMCPAAQQAGKGFTDHTVFNSRTCVATILIKDTRSLPPACGAVIPPDLLTCCMHAPSALSMTGADLLPPDGTCLLLKTTRLLV